MQVAKIIRFSTINIIFSIIFFTACSPSSSNKPKYRPNIKDITVNVEFIRFEEVLSQIDTTDMAASLASLKAAHGVFSDLYLKNIITAGRPVDIGENLKAFLSVKENKLLTDTIRQLYTDINWMKKDIKSCLKYYTYYWETPVIKKIYTFHSLYNYGIFLYGDFAGIGLDFFLGENHVGYQASESLRHQYIRRTLNKQHLVPKFAYAIADDLVNTKASKKGGTLLDDMIFNGKKYYIASILQPNTPDSLVYGFSAYQIEFCKKGETALWEHLGKEQLLYSSDINKYRKYITEGPFRPERDLPGNSASWLGAQIVTQYADRLRKELKVSNPTIGARAIDQQLIQQLLKENNSGEFLKRYKPQKY